MKPNYNTKTGQFILATRKQNQKSYQFYMILNLIIYPIIGSTLIIFITPGISFIGLIFAALLAYYLVAITKGNHLDYQEINNISLLDKFENNHFKDALVNSLKQKQRMTTVGEVSLLEDLLSDEINKNVKQRNEDFINDMTKREI